MVGESPAELTRSRVDRIPGLTAGAGQIAGVADVSFSCVVKTQIRWSNKIYKTELTKTR